MNASNAEKRRVLEALIQRGRWHNAIILAVTSLFLIGVVALIPLLVFIFLPLYLVVNGFCIHFMFDNIKCLKNDDFSWIDDELIKLYRGQTPKNKNPYREGRLAWLRSFRVFR